jgi:hypothetical protein
LAIVDQALALQSGDADEQSRRICAGRVQETQTRGRISVNSSGSFDIQAFGVHFRLTAGCEDAYETLDQYAFPWLPRMEAKAGKPDVAIRIDQAAGKFVLSVGDDLVASDIEARALVRDLIQALDEAVVQRLTALRAIHAGAVEWSGRVLLFPGATHAGKSALVTELLRRGATYFSDEYALIDAEGLVHPYPRPLLVRDGGAEQHPVLARELNTPIGDAPAPVGGIFALAYGKENEWSVAAVSQGEALMTLLRNTPHALAESPEMVAAFQRAVADARCFAGTRGDAADAVDKIRALVGL